jgi:hypothetical protein
VPPGRPELLAGALRRFAEGEVDLAEMGRRALAYAQREGGFERSAEKYLALFDSLSGRSVSRAAVA